MTSAQVVHGSDLGAELEVVNGKVRLNGEKIYGALQADGLHVGVFKNDATNTWVDVNFTEDGLANSNTLTYAELKARFEANKAAYPDAKRFMYQVGATSWGFTKMNDTEWMMGTSWKHIGVGGVTEGYATVSNDPANPLFVKQDGTPVSALETVSTYNLQAARYMRMVAGAKATYEMIVPVRLRSCEIITDVKLSGYCQGSLLATIEYGDGTVAVQRARTYNNNWYLGDIIDQTKPVSKITVEVDATTLVEAGKFPTNFSRDFATGVEYHRSSPDYALGTPFHVYSYWHGYYHHALANRFHLPEVEAVDITADCTITTSIAADPAFPLSNVLDADPATAYKASTTGNSLTLTVQRVSTAPYVFRHVNIKLKLEAGQEAAFESLSRIAVVTSRTNGSSNATSNIHDFTGVNSASVDADGNLDVIAFAGFPNTYPDVTDRMTIALTKLVAGNFKIASVKVFGHTPTAG